LICEYLGRVSDTLVGGMMFHSDHADLMRLLGLMRFARLHEDGYMSDSKAYRKVRAMCIDHGRMLCPSGDQSRGKSLDQLRGKRSDQISAQDRRQLLKGSFEAWAKWEADAASTYAEAAKGLEECEVARHRVLRMQRSAEREMVEAKRALEEMSACGWDLIHAYEIGG
jgi:hypothetical protein